MYYTGVRDGQQEKWKKKAKLKQIVIGFFSTMHLAQCKVYTKFEHSSSHRSREFCLFVSEFYGPVNNEVMSSLSASSGTVPGQG